MWLPLSAIVLLAGVNLFGRLDPDYQQRVLASEAQEAERKAEEARLGELIPKAGPAPKDVRRITFGDLAFSAPGADTPDTASAGYAGWAPQRVKALDGQPVRIEGFMLPVRVENGQVRECLIMANQMTCCFGNVPRFCDFIIARVDGPSVAVLQDEPLIFTGRFKVGDVFEGKAWTSFYSMEIEAVGRPR